MAAEKLPKMRPASSSRAGRQHQQDAEVSEPVGTSTRAKPLKVIVDEPASGVLMLTPVGDINSATASLVADVLLAAYTVASGMIVIDLSRIGHLGSEGVHILLTAQRAAAEAGLGLRLANAPQLIRRLLDRADPHHELRLSTPETLSRGEQASPAVDVVAATKGPSQRT